MAGVNEEYTHIVKKKKVPTHIYIYIYIYTIAVHSFLSCLLKWKSIWIKGIAFFSLNQEATSISKVTSKLIIQQHKCRPLCQALKNGKVEKLLRKIYIIGMRNCCLQEKPKKRNKFTFNVVSFERKSLNDEKENKRKKSNNNNNQHWKQVNKIWKNWAYNIKYIYVIELVIAFSLPLFHKKKKKKQNRINL